MRNATFDEGERRRDITFLDSQYEKENQFLADEGTRVSKFRQAESGRAIAHIDAQKKREGLFKSLQDKLQNQCAEDEARRIYDLKVWASEMLQERKRRQVEGYKDEERAREGRFVRSVDSSALGLLQ